MASLLCRSECFVPVRRTRDMFDDFHMGRWMDWFNDSSVLMDDSLERSRRDWEHRLGHMRSRLHDFSPLLETALPPFEPSSAVTTNPAGKPEFEIQFNAKHFKPEEINVSTKDGKLLVTASHEESTDHSSARRTFKRVLDLPDDVQVDLMKSVISKDGVLSVTAPLSTPALPAPENGTVATCSDGHSALNYHLSIAGYKPEEVAVTVQGHKVKIHAAHEENSDVRKVHKELTKTFELPPEVDPSQVRSFIKDEDTLYIGAPPKDGMRGTIHVVPVTYKKIEYEAKAVTENGEKMETKEQKTKKGKK